MIQYHYYLLVPIGLCEFVLQKKMWTAFKIYLFLKSNSNGHLRIDSRNLDKICFSLSISKRTYRRALKKLSDLNWIGFNQHTGITIINGFDVVRRIESISNRSGVWFSIDYVNMIKSFVISACIHSLIQSQKQKMKVNERDGNRMAPCKSSSLLSSYFPISLESLIQIYNLSRSTASDYRRLSANSPWIQIKYHFEPFLINGQVVKGNKNIKKFRLEYKGSSHISRRLVVRNGILCLQKPCLIKSNLKGGRRPMRKESVKLDKTRTICKME